MQCPSCNSNSLKPIKLQIGLPARQCQKCSGVLIDLLSYREWAEDYSHNSANQQQLMEVEDNSKALVCPKCSKIMLKFRIAGSTLNKIDVCSSCDEAWLDSGEWQLLGSLALQDKLNTIFTEPWQTSIRENDIEISHKTRFKELLGNSDYNKLTEIKDWINGHPQKADLIRFILRDGSTG